MRRLLIAALIPGAALAQDHRAGAITVDHPFIVETPARAQVAGGYATIVNEGGDDRLMGVTVEAGGPAVAQLHEMSMDGEVMRMRQIADGIEIPAGETVTLERGGRHVMFMQLAEPLAEGDAVRATLLFETAGALEVTFEVVARGAAAMHPGAGHMDR